ncbi:hypothetical protein MN869_18895 [Acinetobacter sp. NIPH1876]|uniref:type ISP restriction/modification enzyme n=1 Tax=Acinetobacter sp. NIPH1876 TaxID=2924041 RepID=UPI001FADC954|nr:type ISP restriction/modification enzyme [Acinetobacter sp. NIPH1876]MCJ0830483.1 hypothetical protein [Acinetobacter sp. NIPH1876]
MTKNGLTQNLVICVHTGNDHKGFSVLMTDVVPDLHVAGNSQCFPLYLYEEIKVRSDKHFNKQEDTDVTELEQLKADNQKLTTERDNAVTELKQFKESKRSEDIAALETELKTQFSTEDKTAYTAMDDTTFAFASKQLRQFSAGGQGGQQTPNTTPANQPNPALAHLFTHQANGGSAGVGQAQGSTLDQAFNQFAAAQK